MLYSEIVAVCSQIHTKHLNTLWGQNEELLNVPLHPVTKHPSAHTKPAVTSSNQAPVCTYPVAMLPARRVSLPHSCLQTRFAISSQFMPVTM